MGYDFQPFSLIDAPDSAAIIFCHGCYLKCQYCYNLNLLEDGGMSIHELIPKIKELKQINSNTGKSFNTVNWLVFTGGEPLIQNNFLDLQYLIEIAKDIGLKIALYTNGINFKLLKHFVEDSLIDMLHIDYKHLYYNRVSKLDVFGDVYHSIDIAFENFLRERIKYLYFNTVIAKSLIDIEDLIKMKYLLFAITTKIPIIKEDYFAHKIAWKITPFYNNFNKIPTYKILDYETNNFSEEEINNIIETLRSKNEKEPT